MGHAVLEVDHLVLGLLYEEEGLAARVLQQFGLTYEAVRAQVAPSVPSSLSLIDEIGTSKRALRVLELALREALSLGHNYIGTEHVLLAVVRESGQSAERNVLDAMGVDGEQIRDEIIRMLSGPGGRKRAGARREPPKPPKPSVPPRLEAVRTHADRPAEVDELGRARLAEVLAERMRRVRGEDTEAFVVNRGGRRRKLRDDRRRARGAGSFMIHVHAAWGAGKSSLLRFLAVDLRNRQRREPGLMGALRRLGSAPRRPVSPELSQWVIVEFSAWEHQRLDPPWWWLLAAIRRAASRELWQINRGRWAWFWVRDIAWRIWNSRVGWMTFAFVAGLGLLAWRLDWLGLEGSSLTALQTTAVSLTAIVAFATLVLGRIRGTSRWLAVGSADDAVRFLRRAHDPLGVYRRRYRWLVRSTGRPIAVFVDDLDRCRAEYVVGLLEGIQTVFAAEPVTYVIAADRKWVCEAFETIYSDFDQAVCEPGRPLGFLFLEKTFQVSMEIPPLLHDQRVDYWRSVSEPAASKPAASVADSRSTSWADELSWADSEQELVERVDALRYEPDYENVLRIAMRRLNSPALAAELEGSLREFAPLVESNPRSMKRLVNAYGIERDRLFREQRLPDDEERKRLVLFTILRLRWPLLAEHLLKTPGDVASLTASKPRPPADDRFVDLVQDPDVRALFDGSVVEARLDGDALVRYSGRRPAQSPSVGA